MHWFEWFLLKALLLACLLACSPCAAYFCLIDGFFNNTSAWLTTHIQFILQIGLFFSLFPSCILSPPSLSLSLSWVWLSGLGGLLSSTLVLIFQPVCRRVMLKCTPAVEIGYRDRSG